MDVIKVNIKNSFKTLKTLLIGILICGILLTACSFKPRLPEGIIQQMRALYIDSFNPDHPLIIQLRRTLQALNVQFTPCRKNASVILQINNINWDTSIPPIISINHTISYTYCLHATVALETKEGKRYGPHTFLLNRTLLQNNTQLYTPNATRLVKIKMIRMMVDLIYYYLTTIPNQ